MSLETLAGTSHAGRMDRMYRHQRHIYDLTRKYYLFGRDTMIDGLDAGYGTRVLEVGCGTGRNLARIARLYPHAALSGLDISAEMLTSARAQLRRAGRDDVVLAVEDATRFTPQSFGTSGFDRIVVSYALSMIPDWEAALDAAIDALAPGGSLHIADFGQQENLPPLVRKVLTAWLTRFHVTPRAALFEALKARARRNGARLECRSLGRGYAWLAVYRAA